MRFKAKLAPEHVSLLYGLIGPISRLSGGDSGSVKTGHSALLMGGSVLRLSTDTLRLTTKGKSNDADGISFFAELATHDGIFLEHRIQSATEDNAIAMEIDLIQLRMALQSIVSSNESASYHGKLEAVPVQFSTAILKLAKRDGIPCLCIDAYTKGGVVAVHHSIPVRIMRVEDADYHLPPKVNTPDIQLELPNSYDRPIRIIAERLKAVSPHVYLEASMVGELTLRIDNDGSSVRTFFDKLRPRPEDIRPGGKDPCCVKVDTKKFWTALQWQQPSILPNVSKAILCLVENEMLLIHVMLNPESVGFLTYYVPVHFLSDDQENE